MSHASTSMVSQSIPDSKRPWSQAPMTLKVSQNIRAMIQTKAGIAVYLPVRNLSALRLLSCSLLSLGLTTVAAQSLCIKSNLMSAIAADRSRPLSASIWLIICSMISFSFSLRFRALRTLSSPSANLLAANLKGIPAVAA